MTKSKIPIRGRFSSQKYKSSFHQAHTLANAILGNILILRAFTLPQFLFSYVEVDSTANIKTRITGLTMLVSISSETIDKR